MIKVVQCCRKDKASADAVAWFIVAVALSIYDEGSAAGRTRLQLMLLHCF